MASRILSKAAPVVTGAPNKGKSDSGVKVNSLVSGILSAVAFSSAVILHFLMHNDRPYSCFDVCNIVRKSSITEFMSPSIVTSSK